MSDEESLLFETEQALNEKKGADNSLLLKQLTTKRITEKKMVDVAKEQPSVESNRCRTNSVDVAFYLPNVDAKRKSSHEDSKERACNSRVVEFEHLEALELPFHPIFQTAWDEQIIHDLPPSLIWQTIQMNSTNSGLPVLRSTGDVLDGEIELIKPNIPMGWKFWDQFHQFGGKQLGFVGDVEFGLRGINQHLLLGEWENQFTIWNEIAERGAVDIDAQSTHDFDSHNHDLAPGDFRGLHENCTMNDTSEFVQDCTVFNESTHSKSVNRKACQSAMRLPIVELYPTDPGLTFSDELDDVAIHEKLKASNDAPQVEDDWELAEADFAEDEVVPMCSHVVLCLSIYNSCLNILSW